MGQQAYRTFEPPIEQVAERSWWPGSERIGEDEAAYCRARAEVETRRADEAAHPAARDARALVARQVEDPAVQDWMSEGGSWLVDA
jgi:hypothetical protein